MLIFNNLVINCNSDRYQPFLLNMISGRRHLLSNEEWELIKRMVNKKITEFNDAEMKLFKDLKEIKQFVLDEDFEEYYQIFSKMDLIEMQNKYSADFKISIELTRDCNMSCDFCYVKDRIRTNQRMTKNKIDSIYNFLRNNVDCDEKVNGIPFIRITGGEPLYDIECVETINYIAEKWNNSKILLFTNGTNLLKYFDLLPLKNIFEVHISLDGIEEVHMKRRFGEKYNPQIYSGIINGIKKLLECDVNVIIKTVLDKNNYLKYDLLYNFLKEKGFLNYKNCQLITGLTLDYGNDLDIDINSHNLNEIRIIQEFM